MMLNILISIRKCEKNLVRKKFTLFINFSKIINLERNSIFLYPLISNKLDQIDPLLMMELEGHKLTKIS